MDAIRSSLLSCFLGQQGSRQRVAGEDNLGGGSKIGSVVAGAGVVGVESICTGSMISPSPSALMTQEIDPTVKIWPGFGEDEEPKKCSILFVMKTTHTPTWRANCRQKMFDSPLGVSHDGRFVVDVRVIKNKKAIETQELDRFRPSA